MGGKKAKKGDFRHCIQIITYDADHKVYTAKMSTSSTTTLVGRSYVAGVGVLL